MYLSNLYNRAGARIFWLLITLFAIAGAMLLMVFSKGDMVLWLDSKHSASGDLFFKHFTYLGDGLTGLIALGIVLCLSYRTSVLLSVILLMQLVISQVSKRVLFSK